MYFIPKPSQPTTYGTAEISIDTLSVSTYRIQYQLPVLIPEAPSPTTRENINTLVPFLISRRPLMIHLLQLSTNTFLQHKYFCCYYFLHSIGYFALFFRSPTIIIFTVLLQVLRRR